MKSASYLLHNPGFSKVREFLLANSAVIAQDDTGVPLTYYDPQKWDLQPFGQYVGPIPSFRRHAPSEICRRFRERAADRFQPGLPMAAQPVEPAAGRQEAGSFDGRNGDWLSGCAIGRLSDAEPGVPTTVSGSAPTTCRGPGSFRVSRPS